MVLQIILLVTVQILIDVQLVDAVVEVEVVDAMVEEAVAAEREIVTTTIEEKEAMIGKPI